MSLFHHYGMLHYFHLENTSWTFPFFGTLVIVLIFKLFLRNIFHEVHYHVFHSWNPIPTHYTCVAKYFMPCHRFSIHMALEYTNNIPSCGMEFFQNILAHLGKLSYSLFIIHCSPTSIIASIGIQFEYIEDKSITHVGISMYMQTNIVHVSVFVEIQTKSKLLHEPRA
jgi:hypothetical protein